jgi:glycerol-3-phosphate dehydrogenase
MTVGAELLYAADQEMAIHLSDAVLRRTDLGTLGDPGPEALNTCAQILGEQLGWSAAQQRLEVDLLSNEIADSDTQVVSDQQWNLDT